MSGMICTGKYMLTKKSMTGFDVTIYQEDSKLINQLCYSHFTACRSEEELFEKAEASIRMVHENRDNVMERFFGEDE